jgi:hypothetical protein
MIKRLNFYVQADVHIQAKTKDNSTLMNYKIYHKIIIRLTQFHSDAIKCKLSFFDSQPFF